MSPNFRELLGTRVLIGDGAVGTLLGERGVGFGHPYARANLSHPEMVMDIHTGFLAGASFNPTPEDLDQEVEKVWRKVEAGAHAFWTQPVFEIRALENALERIGDDGVRILPGLMPLRSARQAEFLHHEVPGIYIPKHVRQNLAALPSEDAPRYGVEVAQKLLAEAQPLVGGAYIMPPANAPDLAGMCSRR